MTTDIIIRALEDVAMERYPDYLYNIGVYKEAAVCIQPIDKLNI